MKTRSVLGRPARIAAVLTAALGLAVAAAPLTGTAQAHEAATGTLSFSGDPGEYTTGGQSATYTAGAVQQFDVQGATDGNSVFTSVVTNEGKRWTLHLAAPDGQKLTEGTTYTGALRWPYAQPQDPELAFGEDARQCDTSTGSFTVSHIAFGPYGYVREIDATFEQYCNGATVPARGELHAQMPEPPAELTLGMTLDSAGKVNSQTGQITVGGSVTCNKPAQVAVSGNVDQVQKKATAIGYYETTVACTPGAPVPWTVSFASIEPGTAFRSGAATLRGAAKADDRDYPATVNTGQQTTQVTLDKA
ncbi:hypothetical protein GCM10011579_038010 [Streptomyces albiflavescens]|uniref:Secreted protein n=1 Tax=Streptomyces albiflavescens TaxID=1623582 RepID=A0A917Y4T7_9ACTN|nr:hypothetical protein [Streptomyces albiflavescens]GGN66496.1 hypothetical protein GCM10011579_038010 [Streptomyces albiflavescens]